MNSLMVVDDIRLKKPGEVNPVIVSFQNGMLNNRGLSNANVKLKKTPKGNATTVEITTPNGHVFVPSDNPGTLKRNLLAIRNKKTNKVKLVEVDYELLINSIFPQKDEVTVVPQVKGKETLTLQKMFGGKKAVRRLDQMEKLNVDPNLVANELKDAIQDVDVSLPLNQSNLVDESLQLIVPPCNRNSNIISQVYDLAQLIGEEELSAMTEEVQKTLEDDDYTKACSGFFKDCLKNARETKDSLERRVAGILYSEMLITFLKTPSKKFNQANVKICTFSPLVQNKIINDFCVKTETGINRPLSMRDKAVCYIMAISTICSNYKIDLKLLSAASSYNVKKLGQLAKYCGLSLAANDQLILKMPLPAIPKPPKQKSLKRR